MEDYQRLEASWAAFNRVDPAGMVACASGTAALHLALEALQLPTGTTVLTCDYNMVAAARAITLAGLHPEFLDCDQNLLLNEGEALTALAAEGTTPVALLATHLYGRACKLDRLGAVLSVRPNHLIEDMAQAHGLAISPWSSAACWSFYKNKIVAGEEGGAVWFRNPDHAVLARQLRSLGFTADHNYTHLPRGHNYRLSNAHARLILANLAAYEHNRQRRQEAIHFYDCACPADWRQPPRDCPWVYDLRIPGLEAHQQQQLVQGLQRQGIAARYGFKPMTQQVEYRPYLQHSNTLATRAATEVLSLPLDSTAPQAQQALQTLALLWALCKERTDDAT